MAKLKLDKQPRVMKCRLNRYTFGLRDRIRVLFFGRIYAVVHGKGRTVVLTTRAPKDVERLPGNGK